MKALPNILVISETIPQTVYAGGIQLYRLLKTYPPEKLLVVGSQPHPEAELLKCRYESILWSLERLTRTRFAHLLRSLCVFRLLPELTINSVKSVLKGFKPDLILSVMQVQPYYDLAYRYAKSQNLPLLLIAHDLPERFEMVYSWAQQQQIARNAKIYRYASKRLCVSPQMRDYLEKVYGASGDVLYPNRSEALTPRHPTESLTLKQPGVLTVGYAGSLAYGYGTQLSQMLPAFANAGAQLRVYSRDTLSSDVPAIVSHCGYAPIPELTWAKVKAECDVIVLPYAWSENQYQDLYKTHFPSKLSEYLALGMPVWIVGPEYATGVRWGLQNSDSVLTTTVNHITAWTDALKQLKESSYLRETLSLGAVVAGKRDFDPETISKQFLTSIQEATKI
ncbi:MAG: glycosyltransferase [Fischerella sp.]|nr:glycosyltransferase [Fischerella sp.]